MSKLAKGVIPASLVIDGDIMGMTREQWIRLFRAIEMKHNDKEIDPDSICWIDGSIYMRTKK